MGKDDLELLTANEVASLARVHINTFDRWCKRGHGPPPLDLPVRRYAAADVARWLSAHRAEERVA